MQKYIVHLYTQVHITIAGIQAESMEQAMEVAESQVDLHDLLDNRSIACSKYVIGNGATVEHVGWAEGQPDTYLVDVILDSGEIDYGNAGWFGPDRLPLVDGKNTVERKAESADLATKFMQELLDSVETLSGIADEHGHRTLVDLMYLQQAILKGGFIDHYPDESKVLDIARSLPSGEHWAKFVKIEHMAQSQAFEVILHMENGVDFTWKGDADDKDHAEGQAIAEATAHSGEQVHHVISVRAQ